MAIELNFEGPISVTEIDNVEILSTSGIYLWTVQLPSGSYCVTYVGETSRSFFTRIKEHIIQTLGGNYRICDVDALRQGREVVVWDGMWRRGTRDKVGELINRFEEISVIAKQYLLAQKIFVAQLECDTALRRHLEKEIAGALRTSPTASSLLPDDIRYRSSQLVGKSYTISITSSEPLDGMPKEIII